MTREKIVGTLFETTCIGLLSGFVGGLLLYFTITLNAEARAQELGAMSRATYTCSAGMVASMLAILSIPAGVIFGFGLGAFFLWRKCAAERRPLP